MIYTIPCQTGAGCSCGEIPCELCNGFTDLVAFADNYGFPTNQTPNSSFPFNYSGTDMVGITPWKNSDIISNGSYLERASCFNLGFPSADDQAQMSFDGVIKSDVTVQYEYLLDTSTCPNGGKHLVTWFSNIITDDAAVLSIGSWSSNFSDTLSYIYLDYAYHNSCIQEFPCEDLTGLPQDFDIWRTRTVKKTGNVLTFTDGDYGPTEVVRCWFPLNGQLGMTIGPGVRIKNINITL